MREEAVLVTGASGFVGRALAKRLVQREERVVSMVRDWKQIDLPGHVVRGDVRDQDVLRRVLSDHRVATVFHLAAESIVSVCAEDPIGAIETAVMGTARLLQAVRDVGRPVKVVVMTSDKVYGSSPSPYWEETPLDARHAYEVSKACQDLVARMFHANYEVDVRVVRAVNIYGPDDPNETRVIPRTILRCLQGEPPLLHEGAASMRRQYVYVDDLLSALDTITARGVPGEAYCVGSPDPAMTVLDVMGAITRQMGIAMPEPEVREREERFREVQEQSIDDRKLQALGWSPEVDMAEGLRKTIEWYKVSTC